MKRIELLVVGVFLLVVGTPAFSQETQSTDKGVRAALLELCSQKGFADAYVARCQAAKEFENCSRQAFANSHAQACGEVLNRQSQADAEEKHKLEAIGEAAQATAQMPFMTYDGCCNNNRDQAIRYCKKWAAGWDPEALVWKGWEERERLRLPQRWFKSSVLKANYQGNTTYCPDVLIDQYTFESSLKVPNYCFGQPGSIYKSEDEQQRWGAAKDCAPVHRTVTLPEKQLADIATAKDADFLGKMCLDNDPRSVEERNADPVCIQRAQEIVRAQNEADLLKQRQQAEAKKEVALTAIATVRKNSFRAVGLHRSQSQAQVKSLLLSHGFAPWSCTTQQDRSVSSGYATTCIASRRQGMPDQDNVILLFADVIHRHRDPDSGIIATDGVERVLLLAHYAKTGDEDDVIFGQDNEAF
jgi:hypothetical protein